MTEQTVYIIQIGGDTYYTGLKGLTLKLTSERDDARKMPNAEAHVVRNHLVRLGVKRAVVVPAVEEKHEHAE